MSDMTVAADRAARNPQLPLPFFAPPKPAQLDMFGMSAPASAPDPAPVRQEKGDIYTRVTNTIIDYLERGVRPWEKPWRTSNIAINGIQPLRHNKEPYNGINILILWCAQLEAGYRCSTWMTFKQAKALKAHVRKGEKGTPVVYYSTITKEVETTNGEMEEARVPFLKTYTVFNVEQIEGLPETYGDPIKPREDGPKRMDCLDAFFTATGADIRHGGNWAYFKLTEDFIQMPPLESFNDAESYYVTLAHEMTHWTRHPKRLDRDFGRKKWGDEGYAWEELVAELGAAFLCARLDITPEVREDHAAYIQSWLKVLKSDKRAIFSAAAHAQRAADFLTECGVKALDVAAE